MQPQFTIPPHVVSYIYGASAFDFNHVVTPIFNCSNAKSVSFVDGSLTLDTAVIDFWISILSTVLSP